MGAHYLSALCRGGRGGAAARASAHTAASGDRSHRRPRSHAQATPHARRDEGAGRTTCPWRACTRPPRRAASARAPARAAPARPGAPGRRTRRTRPARPCSSRPPACAARAQAAVGSQTRMGRSSSAGPLPHGRGNQARSKECRNQPRAAQPASGCATGALPERPRPALPDTGCRASRAASRALTSTPRSPPARHGTQTGPPAARLAVSKLSPSPSTTAAGPTARCTRRSACSSASASAALAATVRAAASGSAPPPPAASTSPSVRSP